MSNSIIGIKDKSQIIPESVVASLIKDWNASSAIALARDAAILMMQQDAAITLEDFMELQEQLKDESFGFVFHSVPVIGDSKQPFIMAKNGSGEAVCVAFIGGAFKDITPEKAEHSPSYYAYQRIVKKTERFYNNSSSIDKFMENLRGGEFAEDMDLLLSKGDGIITLLDFNGEFITHGHSSVGGEFSWGKISNTLGYNEGKVEEPKKKGLLGGLSKIGSAISGKTESVTPPPPKVEPKAKETETASVAVPMEFSMWKPPANLNSKNLNRALMQKIGCVPYEARKTYDAGGAFPVPVDNIKFKDLNRYETFRKQCAASASNTVPAVTATQVEKPKDDTKSKASNVAHIVPTEEKKHFNETFQKRPSVMAAIAESRDLVLNPKVLAKLDNRASTTFQEQSGLRQGVYDTLGWSEEDLKDFIKNEPTLAFLHMRDSLLELTLLKATAEKKQDAPAVPEKKGLLGNLRKTG